MYCAIDMQRAIKSRSRFLIMYSFFCFCYSPAALLEFTKEMKKKVLDLNKTMAELHFGFSFFFFKQEFNFPYLIFILQSWKPVTNLFKRRIRSIITSRNCPHYMLFVCIQCYSDFFGVSTF